MFHVDIPLLTMIWWALANNQRYHNVLGPLTLGELQDEVAKMGHRLFTHALPGVGKALDGFHAGLPVGILETSLLDFPLRRAQAGDPVAVDCVRQLAYLFYKLEVPHDPDLVEEFLDEFIKTDQALDDAIDPMFSDHVAAMREVVGHALKGANPRDIQPSHGSGATACRTKAHDKYRTIRYFPSIDEVYPYSEHFYLSASHLADAMVDNELGNEPPTAALTKGGRLLEVLKEGVNLARIVLVPKDSRGPRIISCEPAENMYVQQGIMRVMYRHLETRLVTRGYVNFTDQSINQELARLSSLSDEMATLDLKDASDRVSLQLVRRIFPDDWKECLLACRTPATQLPDGRIVALRKFAPMGSSVCFPVEALVFWASACATQLRLGLFPESYVYGDDIIVPSKVAENVIGDLQGIGLKVNTSKSYQSGPFRESCGGDYSLGSNVTPVRLKKLPDTSVLGLVRTADFVNQVIAKYGMESTAISILDLVQKRVRYIYPFTELDVPCTIRAPYRSSNDVRFRRRWNKQYQRYEHLIITQRCTSTEKHPADWWELLRWQLTRDNRDLADQDSFQPISADAKKLEPGHYTDPRTVRKAWTWAWLG